MSEDHSLSEPGPVETGGSIVEVLVHGADVPPALALPPSAGRSMGPGVSRCCWRTG